MRTQNAISSLYRVRLAAALAALAFSIGAQAAVPSSWWVDVVNDRQSNVRQQLARGVDPNALNDEELPTLMLAIRSEAWEVYDALLADRRTRIEVQNAHGETPLMYLALLGETERVAALIARGAQVNRLGWTPLHYAASRGQVKTAGLLLKQGAMIHAPAPDGTTPLMMAAHSGSRETVQLLLDHGADATAVNLNKNTAADWARERRHTRLADELDEVARRTLARRAGHPEPEAAQKAAPQDAAVPATGSSSRYFDLKRFENED